MPDAELGLAFGEREKKAAGIVRNKSAHGKDDEVDVEWLRDLKLLRVRFHRVVFAMTRASDWYYDYFTIASGVALWPLLSIPIKHQGPGILSQGKFPMFLLAKLGFMQVIGWDRVDENVEEFADTNGERRIRLKSQG